MVRILLLAGADVNAAAIDEETGDTYTPLDVYLHPTDAPHDLEVVELLLDQGAEFGDGAADEARAQGLLDVAALLLAARGAPVTGEVAERL